VTSQHVERNKVGPGRAGRNRLADIIRSRRQVGPSNKILIYTRQDNGIAVPVHSKSVKRLKSDNYRFQACDLSWISNTAGFEPDAHWCL